MTLILALSGSDGVVLAGDSRSVAEEEGRRTVQDTAIKVRQLTNHVGVADSGAGGLTAYLLETLSAEVRDRNIDSATGVAEFARQFLLSEYREQTQGRPSDSLPIVWLLFAGLDQDRQGAYTQPRIFFLDSREGFTIHLVTKGCDYAGIIWIAEYLGSRYYDPSMTVYGLGRLAAWLISETMTQDQRVGGEIVIAQVTRDGYRAVDGVDKMLEEIRRAVDIFRKMFSPPAAK